jgi:CHAT domain-containing protein
MEGAAVRRRSTRHHDALRALVIGAPALDQPIANPLPGAADEARAVAMTLADLAGSLGPLMDFDPSRDVWIEKRLTRRELRHLLTQGDYDIVHFAGHAAFVKEDPDQSSWLLSDGWLWALELRKTLAASKSPPWLIYANACESSQEPDAEHYQQSVYGLATSCLSQGVAAYVGALWSIDDAVAALFAQQFYASLLSERASLGTALWRARNRVKTLLTRDGELRPSREGLGWAGLVLYGDPTAGLLQLMGARAPRASAAFGRASAPGP